MIGLVHIGHGLIWGAVTRLALIKLTNYGGYLPGLIWANFMACLVMGWFKAIASENVSKEIIQEDAGDEVAMTDVIEHTLDERMYNQSIRDVNASTELCGKNNTEETIDGEKKKEKVIRANGTNDNGGSSFFPNSESTDQVPYKAPNFESESINFSRDQLRAESSKSRHSDLKFTSSESVPDTPSLDISGITLFLTTGYASTLSSFSSVILLAFTQSIRFSGYSILEFFAVILSQIGISIFGYLIGRDLGISIKDYVKSHTSDSNNKEPGIRHHIGISNSSLKSEVNPIPTTTPLTSFRTLMRYFDISSLIAGPLLYIANAILIGTVSSSREWTFAILFAPFGAIFRYYLSRLNNSIFPYGTLLANVLGTTLLSIFTLLAKGRKTNNNPIVSSFISCQVLSGLDDGFCGGLTTVSTFVAELLTLDIRKRYIYGITSILLSFSLTIFILGSYNWTHGLVDGVC